jgi:hypothetical protein
MMLVREFDRLRRRNGSILNMSGLEAFHASGTKIDIWHSESNWDWHEENHMSNHSYAQGKKTIAKRHRTNHLAKR